MKAAEDVFEVLEQPLPQRGPAAVGAADAARPSLRFEGLEVRYPGRRLPALRDVQL